MNAILSKNKKATTIFVIRALEVMRSQGVELAPLLEGIGLPSDFMQKRPELIEESLLLRAETHASRAAHEAKIYGLGFLLAEKLIMSDYGISSYAFLSCKTLRKAIEHNIRFEELQIDRHRKELIERGNQAILRYHLVHPVYKNIESPHVRYMLELVLFEMILWVRQALGREYLFDEVHFAFKKSDYTLMYEEYMGCPVKFEQPYTQGIFSSFILSYKLETANEKVATLCGQQCLSLLEELQSKSGLSGKVQQLLSRKPGYYPNMETIANELHMTPRTLRRKLKSENTTYRDIVLQLRLDLACQYLRNTQLSIKEIAYLLDYSAPTVFHRSFFKKYQQSPNNYRMMSL